MSVPVAMIAAVADNGVIGNGNAIPWRLPSDFAHFKRTTLGKPLIMGRKTFESIGKPLPGRANIVVTRNSGFAPDGVTVTASLEAALVRAQQIAAAEGASEVMIGGGAVIYGEAMPMADLLYISHVALSPEGDAHFPPITMNEWENAGELPVSPSPNDSAVYRIAVYRRRAGA